MVTAGNILYCYLVLVELNCARLGHSHGLLHLGLLPVLARELPQQVGTSELRDAPYLLDTINT
jgi:hypothetical protein